MTERERLISILEKARMEAEDTIGSMNSGMAAWYADKLIESGVAPLVHGEWIICSDGYYPYCSVCKEEPDDRKMTKFCPNCGAKMDKKR